MIPLILILKFLKKIFERLTWSQNPKEFFTIPSQQEINALNNDFSDFSGKDFVTSDDSDYHSASTLSENIKIRCLDSCYNKTKICSVLTKFEE